MNSESGRREFSRREFNLVTPGTLAAPLVGPAVVQSAPQEKKPLSATGGRERGLNILFIFADQERYTSKWPTGLSLPGHERLQQTGVTFTQHYTSAIMCTPSRSVILGHPP